MDKILKDMLADFEIIKALGAQLAAMQLDLSLKADRKEMDEKLALKGDLELVNTKVDQLEFETAIEELGEAIGLLGLKFQKKNEEWEERAAEIWKAIDGKMSRDIFEAAMVKVEARLTALMYGLKELKKIVHKLLYPESSGVTRCIACRRPACISGMECVAGDRSPKRPLPHSGGSSDEMENLKKKVEFVSAKRPKLEGPPFPRKIPSIISIPYNTSQHVQHQTGHKNPDLHLAPVGPDLESKGEDQDPKQKTSQIPKLPKIHENRILKSSSRSPRNRPVSSNNKPRHNHRKLIFTNKVLHDAEREKSDQEPKKPILVTVVGSEDSPPSRTSSAVSQSSYEDMVSDTTQSIMSFNPLRVMEDPL
ncbi:uncharacterized protein LOC118205050, partial [Stegodyphus dumicola]|uniref:uncharacterized protein LOC118205050 n=1 Tax=Stegodyphus dumicola TaxID=202533 RepID=UPI0015A760C7